MTPRIDPHSKAGCNWFEQYTLCYRGVWKCQRNNPSKTFLGVGLHSVQRLHWRGQLWDWTWQWQPALSLNAKCKEHDNQPNSQFGNPLGIPSRAVLHCLAGLMSREEVLVWGFLWVRKVWFAFTQQTFAPETFGERRKASYFKKPRMEIWGRMYDVLPRRVPKVQETGQEIVFSYSQERAQ